VAESGWIANCFGSNVWCFHRLHRFCGLEIVNGMYDMRIERDSHANDFGGRSCEATDSNSERLMINRKLKLFFVGITATSFFSVGRFESLETVMIYVLFVEAS
jgi:hypothetical protein